MATVAMATEPPVVTEALTQLL